MFTRLLEFQIKYAKILTVAFFLVFILLAFIGSNLQIDPSFSSLVSQDSDFNTNDRLLKKSFEQNDAIVILLKTDKTTIAQNALTTLTDPRIERYIIDIKETVSQSQYVTSVTGPFYSDDNTYAQVIVGLSVPQKVNGFQSALEEVRALNALVGTPVGVDAVVTGFPVVLDRISLLLIKDNLVTIFITLGLIILVLYWYSRDWAFTFVTVMSPLASLITLAASMVILDISVTITLAAVGVLALGLGADYSIHIATHYRHAMGRLHDHKKALIYTIRDLRKPITASFITTLAGFAALILGVSPSSQAQGIVLSLSIAIIYAISFISFPILLTSFAPLMKYKPNKTFNAIRKLLVKLALVQIHRPKTVLVIVGIITVFMFFGAAQVSFSTSNSNWIPENDPISKSFREINYIYGDSERLQIIIQSTSGDLRDVQTAKDVQYLVQQIESIPQIERVQSPFTDIPYTNEDIFNEITFGDVRSQFNDQYTLTTLQLVTSNLEQDEAGDSRVLSEIRDIVYRTPIHNAQAKPHGDAVRFEELGNSLEADAGKTTLIGLVLVFLVASFVYFSFVTGFLALVPIIIAILWAIGLKGYFGVPFTSLSTGIVSLVLGIGVDFSIHLVDGILKKVKKEGLEEAITHTLTSSGSAILLSSVTTFTGFMALAFATLLGTKRLGFSLSLSVLAVFIVTITTVPAIMSILFKKHKKTRRTQRI